MQRLAPVVNTRQAIKTDRVGTEAFAGRKEIPSRVV
jgi:hypothetical protein